MYRLQTPKRQDRKRVIHSCLVQVFLLISSGLWGCLQASQVTNNNQVVLRSRIRPIDVDAAEKVGHEALEKIGYEKIIKLADQAGFVEYKSDERIQLASNGPVVATAFVPVFSRYAAAAAVASQADSPLPGPADIAAVGVVVIGLVDPGLLDGHLLNTLEEWLSSPARTDVAAGSGPVVATMPTATSILTEVPITADPQVRQTCAATHPSHRICSSLPADYTSSSAGAALVAMKTTLGDKSLRLHSPDPTESGPCPDTGSHYNVRQGGKRAGSITCCPCCIDGPDGSALSTRCRIHW